ncbi:MAG: nitric oxide reductase [bacterium]|nr:nitric oxide reductase [bacterium]
MTQSWLDNLLSRKGLYTAFWTIGILMVVALIVFTANLAKEVPPIPKNVVSASGETLYTYDDVVNGKGMFQQFDLMDYGTMLGMGAYMGPDFSTEFFHKRAVYLYDHMSMAEYGVPATQLTVAQRSFVKEKVKADFKQQTLTDNTVTYSDASAEAYKSNTEWLVEFLVNGTDAPAWTGGVITVEEATLIAAFVDWSQLVASSNRPGTERTWSNNWPPEPMVDQDTTWLSHWVSLWEFLLLWAGTIVVLFISYEKLIKKDDEEGFESPLVITKLFPSQEKLLKYIPVVALFFLLQMLIGGYLAHIYTEPNKAFIVNQSILPFNVMRALHINLAIIWVAIGWLVGGLMIAPLVAKEDLKFPWLVDVLWAALLIVGGGGLIGIYLGATGHMREVWFWFGNEGRELLNLARVWDIGLVVGLVMWFLMVFSVIRKAKGNNILVGTIIWSAFGIATLYIAGMMPIHKIEPNFTVDDYYRWWVVHLWVELTFELFAAGVLAFLTVALGLISRKTAERIMLFELGLIMLGGTLGVGHHYWWQGLDEHWIAIGGIFSALEPLPLAVMMIAAWKEQKHINEQGRDFPFAIPFLFLAGSAFLNWFGAGFLGMVINTPTINYYAHGTYLIMPHGHVALLGAFGYISLAFMYLVARSNAMAKNLVWDDKWSRIGFWTVTIGVCIYVIPTMVIGAKQAQVAHELGYWAARQRETVEPLNGWMWSRLIPDVTMIIGAAIIFFDLLKKTFFSKKTV